MSYSCLSFQELARGLEYRELLVKWEYTFQGGVNVGLQFYSLFNTIINKEKYKSKLCVFILNMSSDARVGLCLGPDLIVNPTCLVGVYFSSPLTCPVLPKKK